MDLIIEKKDLMRLLSRVQGVTARKSTMPVLSCVLLSARDGALKASVSDLFVSISSWVSAEITTSGDVALPSKELYERVRAMPDGKVRLTETDACTVKIKALEGHREFRLRGMPSDDFPALPKPDEQSSVSTIAPATLADLIAKTQFAISTDETRPSLNSALFEQADDIARMVATDGHRLAKIERVTRERSE